MDNTFDMVVIGQGPAGIQAAIYTQRAGFNTLVIAPGHGDLAKSHLIGNYYGFVDGIDGPTLQDVGIEQAKNLGVEFLCEEVTGTTFVEAGYQVHTTSKTIGADVIIVASGLPKQQSKVKGAKELLGMGVSYCATCDGFFYKDREIAIVGNGEFALAEANELSSVVGKIYILLNDKTANADFSRYEVIPDKIQELQADDQGFLSAVQFSSGKQLTVPGLFFAEGQANALNLALKLGLETNERGIKVDECQRTNLPGVFAAGDCTGGRAQVAVAVGQGAIAGMEAADYIRELRSLKKQAVQWG